MLALPGHICLFVIDLISFLFVGGVFIGIKSPSSLPIYSKDFQKDAFKYSVPYQEPAIGAGTMSILSHFTPMVLIVILCVLRSLQGEGFNTGLKTYVSSQKLGRITISPGVMSWLFYTGYFLFGAFLMGILQTSIAHMVGGLAPNFLDVCQPNYSDSDTLVAHTRSICTGKEHDVLKASLSMPSQYASHLSFGFFFNACTIYSIPQLKKVPMTRLLLTFIMALLGVVGSLTRYIDGFNSLLEVALGVVLGVLCAACIIFPVLSLFGLMESSNEDAHLKVAYPSQPQSATFDQLSNLPYTDLEVEMDEQ